MKKVVSLLFILSLSLLIAACGGTETAENSNRNSAEPAKSLEATLTDLDKSAGEAMIKKDGRFFERFLANGFVGQTPDGPVDKAVVVKMLGENDCDIKSTSSSGVKVTELADGVALFTGKSSSEGTCGGAAIPEAYFATLYVKEGDNWKAAFYQDVSIPPKEDAKADGAAKKEEKPAAGGEEKKEGATIKPNIQNDEVLAKMFAGKESELWMAWAKKDTKPFEEALADNYSEIGDKGVMDRAAAIKDVAENKCEVTGTSVTEVKATKVNDNFVIVTYKGTAKGTCDGKAMPDIPLYTSSIWMKDGDSWKGVFHMFTPGMRS